MTLWRHLSIISEFLFDDRWHKPTIVVAGYGWATHAFLGSISHKDYNVQVVSECNKRLNQNLMIGSLVPSYTPSGVDVIQDRCVSVDMGGKRLRGLARDYPYDYLVIATGSEAHDFGIPGVWKYCQMCKTAADVDAIRKSTKTSAIVLGAGPTGVELACSLYRRGVRDIQVVEGMPLILPGFSDAFRAAALANLERKGIRVLLNQSIREVSQEAIVTQMGNILYSQNDLLVWTCGVRPVEFVRSLEPRGIVVDDQLQYAPNVFVMGDAVKNKGPPTAQNASQQGQYLANLFNSRFVKKDPYVFREAGRCLNLGDSHLIEIYGVLCVVPHMTWQELTWIASV